MYFLLVYAKISLWHCGGVVTQRSAKPCTPVQFRSVPPIYRSRCGEFSRKSHDFGSIISLSPNGGIGIRVRLKIEWRNPYGFKSHFGHQQIFPKYLTLCQISVKLKQYASLAQLFRALPCQGRGRELESLSSHQMVFLLIRLFRAYFYLLLISIKPVVFSPLVFSFHWGTNALFF